MAALAIGMQHRAQAVTGKLLPGLLYASEMTGFSMTKLKQLRSATNRALLGGASRYGAPDFLTVLHGGFWVDPESAGYLHLCRSLRAAV